MSVSVGSLGLLIERACQMDDGEDIIDEIEAAVDIVDCLLTSGMQRFNRAELSRLRIRLVSLHERWSLHNARHSVCSEVAVGITDLQEQGRVVPTSTVGRPRVAINVELVELMHSSGFTKSEIAKALLISRTTLWRRLREQGIHLDSYSELSDDDLDELVRCIHSRHPCFGYSLMKGMLEQQNIKVQRYRLRESIRRTDPVGTSLRWAQVIRHRVYRVPGPNALWHVDGHHKLIRWRFVIHGCIDGYSRLILYLRCSTNNRSATVLELFENAVRSFGLPSRVRCDKGVENFHMCEYMIRNRGTGRHSVIAGASTHNQRIERLWRDVYRCVASTFHSLFYHLEEFCNLDPLSETDLFVLHYVFLPRINQCLDEFLESWNRHPLRTERSWPPRKIWLNGIMHPCNSTQVGIQSVTDSIDPDEYGVDEEGPLPLEMDCDDDVVVPETIVPLVGRQLNAFQQAVDPLEQCDDLGISMFVRAKQLLSQLLGQV